MKSQSRISRNDGLDRDPGPKFFSIRPSRNILGENIFRDVDPNKSKAMIDGGCELQSSLGQWGPATRNFQGEATEGVKGACFEHFQPATLLASREEVMAEAFARSVFQRIP